MFQTDVKTDQLLRLGAAGALAYCSYAMCRSPVLPLFARDLGAGPEAVGFIVGASTLTGVFLKFPAGALSDVLGRRAMLLAAATVFAALPFMYVMVAGLGALVAIRFVHGSATATFGPVAAATLSDLAPPDRRGAWLSTYSSLQGAGQAFGPVLAGFLIVQNSYDRAFVASGIIGAGALALLLGRPGSAETPHEPGISVWRRFRRGLLDVAQDARILTTSLAQAAQFLLNGTVNAFLPLFAREALALNAFQIGLLFGVQTVCTLAARPIFGAWSDRHGRRPAIMAGLLVCAIAILGIAEADGFGSVLALAALYGTGLAVTTSATSAYITDLSRRARYGAAHGIFGTIYDVGDALGPILAGVLVAWLDYRWMFRTMAVGAMALGLAFAGLSRRWKPDVT